MYYLTAQHVALDPEELELHQLLEGGWNAACDFISPFVPVQREVLKLQPRISHSYRAIIPPPVIIGGRSTNMRAETGGLLEAFFLFY